MAIAIQKTTLIDADGIVACRIDLGGRGPARLFVANIGAQAIDEAVVSLGSPSVGAKAALETSLTGDDNDLTYTARVGGADGNDITIEYLDPGTPNAKLAVSLSKKAITVSLATNGAGAIVTTANTIKAALAHEEEIRRLVTVADTSGNDGSGVVTEMNAGAPGDGEPLAGGTDYVVAIDTTTFAALAASAVKSLVVAAPVGLLLFVANKGAGGDTTLLVWVEVDPGA